MKRHLTFTGVSAGYPICGAGWNARTGNDVHAQYAPLDNPEFRAGVCGDCLFACAESYIDVDGAGGHVDENAPEWVRNLLESKSCQ